MATGTVTKRSALALIAQLYDSLGWISPITVSLKIFMQSRWHTGLQWEDELTGRLRRKWDFLIGQLPQLGQISLPLWIGLSDDVPLAELHGFSDASEHAYAACIYFRTLDHDGKALSVLIVSKSKVALLKQISLPHLELCTALLLVRLTTRVQETLSLKSTVCHLWSDSKVAL